MTQSQSTQSKEIGLDESSIAFSADSDPSPEEAIALTVAITRYHAEQSTTEDEDADWTPNRWALLGRFANLGTPVDGLPRELPGDPWRSSGRTDLY